MVLTINNRAGGNAPVGSEPMVKKIVSLSHFLHYFIFRIDKTPLFDMIASPIQQYFLFLQVRIMRKRWIIVAFVLVLIAFGFSHRSMAGCKWDCRDEYGSEVESCKEMCDDPGDADMLRMCIDDAKSQYQSCIDECEN
jgi:hypothetical protein